MLPAVSLYYKKALLVSVRQHNCFWHWKKTCFHKGIARKTGLFFSKVKSLKFRKHKVTLQRRFSLLTIISLDLAIKEQVGCLLEQLTHVRCDLPLHLQRKKDHSSNLHLSVT